MPSLLEAYGTSITISENSDLNMQHPGSYLSRSTGCNYQLETKSVISKFLSDTLLDSEEANKY